MKNIVDKSAKQFDNEMPYRKWREYVQAEKEHPGRQELKQLKRIYHQLKEGKTVINVFDVIAAAGVHQNTFHPKLAIARANATNCWCRYWRDGNVTFYAQNPGTGWRNIALSQKVVLNNCLPKFPNQTLSELSLKAPVPLIPGRIRPKTITDDMFILWEVDKWEQLPPTDPYLLRRLSPLMFVVVAAWDLTPVEKSVMHGML